MYQVYDTRTGQIMGTYQTLKRATRKIDKLDLAYGAVRYSYKHINQEED